MAKMITSILFIFYFFNCFCQQKKDLWWLKTSSNKKYETNYKYAFSNIKEGVLKQEIKKFIKTHIIDTDRDREKIAIELNIHPVEQKGKQIYSITYRSNYYSILNTNTSICINQISLIKEKIVFIKNYNLKDISINKEILYGLLRDRFKEDVKALNLRYGKEFQDEEIIPALISPLEHQIPKWLITIKDGELVRKEEIFE